MDREFLEWVSQTIYDNPKVCQTGPEKDNEQRTRIAFVRYDIQKDKEYFIDAMSYKIILSVGLQTTKLAIHPMVLTKSGWVEFEEPFEHILWDDDHLLFKPLVAIIEKSYQEDREKSLKKIQQKFLGGKTTDVDPLTALYNDIKEEAREANAKPKKTGAFGGGDAQIMDFTKEDWKE
jgi:hypothetical protein